MNLVERKGIMYFYYLAVAIYVNGRGLLCSPKPLVSGFLLVLNWGCCCLCGKKMNKRLLVLLINSNCFVPSGICLKNYWILKGKEKWKIFLMGFSLCGVWLLSTSCGFPGAEVFFEPSFRTCTLRADSFRVGVLHGYSVSWPGDLRGRGDEILCFIFCSDLT